VIQSNFKLLYGGYLLSRISISNVFLGDLMVFIQFQIYQQCPYNNKK